jgi:hypothetical protein
VFARFGAKSTMRSIVGCMLLARSYSSRPSGPRAALGSERLHAELHRARVVERVALAPAVRGLHQATSRFDGVLTARPTRFFTSAPRGQR